MLTHKIEHHIRKLLTGEAQANALEFAAHLRANGMEPVRFKNNYWKDKCFWAARCRGEDVCHVLLNGSPAQDKTEPEGWIIWSDDSGSKWYEDAPIDERTREIAWRHVDFGTCGSQSNPAGRKTIFGREFEPVCGSVLRFNNPDTEALECAKKIFAIRKEDILRRA